MGHPLLPGRSAGAAEAQAAIGTIARRLPGLALASPTPEWREASALRGLKVLPVTF